MLKNVENNKLHKMVTSTFRIFVQEHTTLYNLLDLPLIKTNLLRIHFLK